jgi:hypothetical protein
MIQFLSKYAPLSRKPNLFVSILGHVCDPLISMVAAVLSVNCLRTQLHLLNVADEGIFLVRKCTCTEFACKIWIQTCLSLHNLKLEPESF